MDKYELEQAIMQAWLTADDLQLLIEMCSDANVGKDIQNVLIGIKTLHNLRCEKLFSTYERVLFP